MGAADYRRFSPRANQSGMFAAENLAQAAGATRIFYREGAKSAKLGEEFSQRYRRSEKSFQEKKKCADINEVREEDNLSATPPASARTFPGALRWRWRPGG
jgi:hypothetical protein